MRSCRSARWPGRPSSRRDREPRYPGPRPRVSRHSTFSRGASGGLLGSGTHFPPLAIQTEREWRETRDRGYPEGVVDADGDVVPALELCEDEPDAGVVLVPVDVEEVDGGGAAVVVLVVEADPVVAGVVD
jgi:hypothetical protein